MAGKESDFLNSKHEIRAKHRVSGQFETSTNVRNANDQKENGRFEF
jgi:hypothetical protein